MPENTGMLVAGGFLGDFIKGPVPDHLPAVLAQGVRLHRRVDAYSNLQPGIRNSCRRFPAGLRRLAPVLVDVVADHFLATEWEQHHHQPLAEFTRYTYRQIGLHAHTLSDSGREFFVYMRDTDLLARYRDWAVVSRSIGSVTRRLDRSGLDPLIAQAMPELLDGLREDFHDYFPDIVAHARGWLSAAPQNS